MARRVRERSSRMNLHRTTTAAIDHAFAGRYQYMTSFPYEISRNIASYHLQHSKNLAQQFKVDEGII